ncbi:MAG: OmpA family protein, partial [bacterium]
MSQPRLTLLGGMAVTLLVAGACTTKNYVRQQTTPLINHVNQLDQETAKNSNDLRQVNQQTQAGLQQANAASQAALQHAQQVQSQAQQVNQQLQQTSTRVTALDSTVANLDNYKQASDATVHFGFDKSNLTPV